MLPWLEIQEREQLKTTEKAIPVSKMLTQICLRRNFVNLRAVKAMFCNVTGFT